MQSCIYEGWVRHRRRAPVEHSFRYRIALLYLSLDELTDVFRGRWLWSAKRPALARFRRSDHLGDPRQPLDEAVRDFVEQSGRRRPGGPIRLLTQMRYFGFGFNPVSFYYCYAAGGERLESVIAEVNNTPWGEQHCYLLDAPPISEKKAATPLEATLEKQFHVSPFMPIDVQYVWRLSQPAKSLDVGIENQRAGKTFFDAQLSLERRAISTANLHRMLIRYPLASYQVFAAIYWQALRLWLKKAPYFPHPRRTPAALPSTDAARPTT